MKTILVKIQKSRAGTETYFQIFGAYKLYNGQRFMKNEAFMIGSASLDEAAAEGFKDRVIEMVAKRYSADNVEIV